MRTITYLGVGLLVCGAIIFVASSGAFDSTLADRDISVGTADDEDALVGIDHSDTILSAEEGEFACTEQSSFWFFQYCSDGEFTYDEILLFVSDQTATAEFERIDINEIAGFNDNPSIESTTVENDGSEYTLEASIRCNAECTGGSLVDDACQSPIGSGEAVQRSASQTGTVDLEANGQTVSVDLDRTVEIECEAGTVTEPG
ncbi:hypothetical protein [Natronorubrum sp. DTA28]|uniref:hypothetical protein n=1 Tax=Natronorubrum sp. DTA28 TaxID=3447019 RepID=UPI003F87661F